MTAAARLYIERSRTPGTREYARRIAAERARDEQERRQWEAQESAPLAYDTGFDPWARSDAAW